MEHESSDMWKANAQCVKYVEGQGLAWERKVLTIFEAMWEGRGRGIMNHVINFMIIVDTRMKVLLACMC